MALHSELPIYKVAYDLLALILQVTRNMPRDVKQQVGTALRDECVQITVLIFRANNNVDFYYSWSAHGLGGVAGVFAMTDPILSDLRRIAQTYPTRGTQDAVIAAVDEIQRLRSDLAAARDEAKISEDALQSACVKALNERDQLRQNLAAARALLRDCRSLVRCESLDHYRKADQHDGFGPCPIEMRMKYAIDAAIAGEKK